MKHKSIPKEIVDYLQVDLTIPHGLRWIKLTPGNNRCTIGDPAGSKCFDGKYNLHYKGIKYYNHRIIFYLQNNLDPNCYQVDHKIHDDNTGELRLATHQQNHFNRRSCIGSSSKHKGISWHIKDKRWEARIGFNGQNIYIGKYLNEEEAALAYNQKAIELFGEYAFLNQLTQST
jgi:hypothetical protein